MLPKISDPLISNGTEEVKVLKSDLIDPLSTSNESNLPDCDPLVISNESNLPSCEPLFVSNSPSLRSVAVNVVSTDDDKSLIDEDREEDKSVKSLLTWSNDDDTDCDNSFIDDDNDDESVVNSLSTTMFSSEPNGPAIHLSLVVSHT